jgi:uncharacterized protein (DUF2236 family)
MAEFGAEGILLAGAGRALLLQLADPAVGRGVDEHSTFVGRPVNRLKGTLTYVYAIVYGTDEQVKEVRRRVNQAHVPVRREAREVPPDTTPTIPNWQLWVVATLYDTAITIIEKIYGPLDDDSADAMYRDYARLGTALQVPPRDVAGGPGGIQPLLEGGISTLRAEDGGVRVGRGLLYPKHTALWYRAIMPSARFLTAGLLPDQIRKDFGLAVERPPRAALQPHHQDPGRGLSEAAPGHQALVQELLPEQPGAKSAQAATPARPAMNA